MHDVVQRVKFAELLRNCDFAGMALIRGGIFSIEHARILNPSQKVVTPQLNTLSNMNCCWEQRARLR